MTTTDHESDEAKDIRTLIERWAHAVRAHDYEGILADHDEGVVMFDVPPPMQFRGIDAYRHTWDIFFGVHRPGNLFDILEMDITAGADVAFAVMLMRCGGPVGHKDYPLDFRLTVGLRKVDGRWRVLHEHHSVPAE